MRRLRLPVTVAAVALLLTALLMWRADGPAPAQRASPEFPRHMDQRDWERARSRRTAPAPTVGAVPSVPGSPPAEAAPRRDPFLAALPALADKPLVVLEANALRHSRLGELFIRCVLQPPGKEDAIERFRSESGVDPLKDVDRIAFAQDGILVSGFFDRARFDRIEELADREPGARVEQAAYGARGRVYRVGKAGDSPVGEVAFGRWGDELLVFGPEAFVRESIDRVEGRAAAPEQQFPEDLTYGEAYGVIPGAALEPLLRGTPNGIGARLAALASRVELHADAMSDVALVARVSGSDAAGLDDLASSIGAAMAVGRLQAKARGTTELADVLEHARVERGHSGAGFSVELAIPADVLERWFAGCGDEPTRAVGGEAGGAAPPR